MIIRVSKIAHEIDERLDCHITHTHKRHVPWEKMYDF